METSLAKPRPRRCIVSEHAFGLHSPWTSSVHPSLEGGQGSQKDKAAYRRVPEISLEKFPGVLDPGLRTCIYKHHPGKSETGSNNPNHSHNKAKMAKSQRSSVTKANNQRLKKNVFGPVEAARQQRLSAKLLEIASQPKPVPEKEMKDAAEKGMVPFTLPTKYQDGEPQTDLLSTTAEPEETKAAGEAKSEDSEFDQSRMLWMPCL